MSYIHVGITLIVEPLGSQSDEEVLDTGVRRPVAMRSVVVLLAVAVLAAGAGFLLGHRNRSADHVRPTVTATVTASPATTTVAHSGPGDLDATDRQCSLVPGVGRLQLGVEVLNNADGPVDLQDLRAVLPLGGLHATATALGTCGQLPPPIPVHGYRIAPATTVWLTITFDVHEPCPGALPVGFRLRYVEDDALVTETVAFFADLGDVPYPTCPTGH